MSSISFASPFIVVQLDTYEILVGNMQGLRWVDAHGHLHVAALGYTPVEGGHEADGTPLYIAKAPYHNAVHPGKASEKFEGALIPYNGTEKVVKVSIFCSSFINNNRIW